jgi:general secretion pathway protein C
MTQRLTTPALTLSLLALAALALALPSSEVMRVQLEPLTPWDPPAAPPVETGALTLARPRLHHLFGLTEAEAHTPPPPRPPRTPFAARLLGTMTSSVPGHSAATLLLPSGRATTAWEGEWLLDAQIVTIAHQFITLRRDGVDEFLYMQGASTPPPGPAPIRALDGRLAVSRAEVLSRLSDLPQLSSEVRVVPAFKDGRPIGFRLFAAKPEWAPGQLGVQSGDVLRAVNGQPLDSMQRVLALSALLERGGDVELELERGGQVIHQRYRLD